MGAGASESASDFLLRWDRAMVYNSDFNEMQPEAVIMGCGVFPLRTQFPGPCTQKADAVDVIDEAFTKFKANCMFRQFKPKGHGDLVHIYLLLFIHKCLNGLEKAKNKADGQRILNSLGGETPATPGDSSFPISVIFPEPQSAAEKKELAKYFTQLRKEPAARMPAIVFPDAAEPASKWWLAFAKRPFIKKSLYSHRGSWNSDTVRDMH